MSVSRATSATNTDPPNRRRFLATSAVAAASLTLSGRTTRASTLRTNAVAANDTIRVGVMGTGGRGTSLAATIARQSGVAVTHLCDVDSGRAAAAVAAVRKAIEKQPDAAAREPQAVGDFRRVLDDKSVDVLIVATCNHWHAPGAILACAAGKHVYVEKPCSHNPHEGELLVAAARRHKRHVQMGNQRRSWTKVAEAIEQVRGGAIGRAYFAQSWYYANRPSIGKKQPSAPPANLDFNLWQGPAPRRPFRENILHYNWHWFWDWGNGELGNNGIHFIDICRWGLGVDYPIHVSSSGGRYRYDDDQETPDTHLVSFDFADRKTITWQGLSCNQSPQRPEIDILFHGETGSLGITGGGYTLFDLKGKEVKKVGGGGSEVDHLRNFLDTVRGGGKLNSEIEDGHKSTLLCHLGNIAHRTGRALRCDAKNGHILGDDAAAAMWRREYEPGWSPEEMLKGK